MALETCVGVNEPFPAQKLGLIQTLKAWQTEIHSQKRMQKAVSKSRCSVSQGDHSFSRGSRVKVKYRPGLLLLGVRRSDWRGWDIPSKCHPMLLSFLKEKRKSVCSHVCVYAHASGLLCLCFSAVLQIRPEVPARFPPVGVRGAGKIRGLQKLRSHSWCDHLVWSLSPKTVSATEVVPESLF